MRMPELLRLWRSSETEHYRLGPGRLAGAAALATTAALVTRLRRLEVSGHSMRPTLEPGDRLLLLRSRRARAGDLVVVPDPRQPARLVVKRVVVASGGGLTVRGDNPAASTDSRQFGTVPKASVWGRVVYRYGPDRRRGRIPRLVP
jgi:nickel-type superoxide dismutase maturation protease